MQEQTSHDILDDVGKRVTKEVVHEVDKLSDDLSELVISFANIARIKISGELLNSNSGVIQYAKRI